MQFKALTDSNFYLYACKMYNSPSCEGIDEFNEDMNRIKYIKRLFGKYETKGIMRERLVLNHIIILNNLFGNEACCRILFFRLEEKYYSYLKSFLSYLQYLPYEIPEVDLSKTPTDNRIDYILKMEEY